MLYTLITLVLHLSKPEEVPIIKKTYTFKTLALCEKALDDNLDFINEKKFSKIVSEHIENKIDSSRILKVIFIDKNMVSYSKCVKSEIAFNKESFKKNIN